MEILSSILIGLGLIISGVYGIILLVKAFQTSVLWGLGYLFIPFVSLIFIIVHWNVAGKPFLMSLVGVPLIIIGFLIMPDVMSLLESLSESQGSY